MSLMDHTKRAIKKTENPIKLTFKDLEYEVEIKNGPKRGIRQKIIRGVSGYAMPGQTLFIMGASGAGKTSLLNILSDRISLKMGATLKKNIKINDTMEVDD